MEPLADVTGRDIVKHVGMHCLRLLRGELRPAVFFAVATVFGQWADAGFTHKAWTTLRPEVFLPLYVGAGWLILALIVHGCRAPLHIANARLKGERASRQQLQDR